MSVLFLILFFLLGFGTLHAQIEEDIGVIVERIKEDINETRSNIMYMNKLIRENMVELKRYQDDLSAIKADVKELGAKIGDIEMKIGEIKKKMDVREYVEELTKIRSEMNMMKKNMFFAYILLIFALFLSVLAIFVGKRGRRRKSILKI